MASTARRLPAAQALADHRRPAHAHAMRSMRSAADVLAGDRAALRREQEAVMALLKTNRRGTPATMKNYSAAIDAPLRRLGQKRRLAALRPAPDRSTGPEHRKIWSADLRRHSRAEFGRPAQELAGDATHQSRLAAIAARLGDARRSMALETGRER